MKYCVQCGAQMKDEALFCPKCGRRIQEAVNTAARGIHTVKPERKKGSRTKFIVTAVLLVAAVVSVGVCMYGRLKPAGNKSESTTKEDDGEHDRYTLTGEWKLAEKSGGGTGSFDITDPKDILVRTFLTLTEGARIVFTEDGKLLVRESFGSLSTDIGSMEYTTGSNNSITINFSVTVLGRKVSAGYTCHCVFQGSDRLTIYMGDTTLILTRN